VQPNDSAVSGTADFHARPVDSILIRGFIHHSDDGRFTRIRPLWTDSSERDEVLTRPDWNQRNTENRTRGRYKDLEMTSLF